MTDISNKLGKLAKLKELQTNSGAIENRGQEAQEKNTTEAKPEVNKQKDEGTVTLTPTELSEVIETKVEAKIHKQNQVKPKKKQEEKNTHTTVRDDLSFEVALLCKKNKIFQHKLNNHLYNKLIEEKGFLKQILDEMKEKGEIRG